MTSLEYDAYDVLTFDTYGTLIDWETGIAAALHETLGPSADALCDDDLLICFAGAEHEFETPGTRYRDVLERTVRRVAAELGTTVPDRRAAAFGGSVGDWPAFPDTALALQRLHTRFALATITNCDDDLFASSKTRLGVTFDVVVTAQQVGRYKPDPAGFHVAFERIQRELGVPRDRILHVAQSLFHDHVTAKRLGMRTVWIDRREGRAGGATPAAETPVEPDARFTSLRDFAATAVPAP
jgi:2-haloacid dehalogenase